MKEEGTVASTFVSNTSGSYNSNMNGKYGGLITVSAFKQLKYSLSQLISYIYSVSSTMRVTHNVVTIFRILQFVGPAICAPYKEFWNTNDYSQQTVSIVSIFFHIVPPEYRKDAFIIFMSVYIALYAIFLLVTISSALYYKKNATLPMVITKFIVIFISTFGYLLYPIGFELMFEQIARCIFKRDEIELISSIVLIIVGVIVTVAYFWFYIFFATRTLVFRPDSLMTSMPAPQNIIFLQVMVINALIGFGSQSKYQYVFVFLAAITYMASMSPLYIYGGLIANKISNAYAASALTGTICTIIVGVMLVLQKQGSLAFFIAFVCVYILLFLFSSVMRNKYIYQNLAILDAVMDDPETNYALVKSPNKMVTTTIIGFQHAHPICLNWTFSRMATDKWPESAASWFVFAKFVAIYPEETQKLAWIFHTIITLQVHGADARTIKEQSLSIARQRESNISMELKTKLNVISRHLQSTKHKLRHVWDLVIQGNVSEMEKSTKRAIKEIEQNDAEFMHVLRQFPNNRFVTRNYARFCKEVKADQVSFNDMLEKTRMLQRGITVNPDQAHELGMLAFPELPAKIQVGKDNSQVFTESISQSITELEPDDEMGQDMEQTSILKSRIEKLQIPATRCSIFIRVIMFFILYLVPIIGMLVYSNYFIDEIIEPLEHMYNIALVRTMLYQINGFGMYYIYQALGIWTEPDPTTNRTLDYLGGSWNTQDQLYYILTSTTMYLQNMENFRTFNPNSPIIDQCHDMIFAQTVSYVYFENQDANRTESVSAIAGINDFVLQLADPVKNMSAITPSILNTSAVLNMNWNITPLGKNIRLMQEAMVQYIQEKDISFQKYALIVMIVVIIVIVIAFFGALYGQLIWIDKTKEEVYKSLTSLPKNTVSSLAENLRVLKKENEEMSTTNTNTEMNRQEDNILKIFMTGGTDSSSSMLDKIMIILSTIVIVALHIGCTVQLTSLFEFISQRNARYSPHLIYLQGAYNQGLGAITLVMFLTVINSSYHVPNLDTATLFTRYEDRSKRSRENYHLTRYGGETSEEIPYVGFKEADIYADSMMDCVDKYATPTSFLDATKCYSADGIMILIESVTRSRVKPHRSKLTNITWEPIWENLWSLEIFPLWDVYIAPMFLKIVPTIKSDLKHKENTTIPSIITMFIIGFLFEVVANLQILNIQKHIREVLKLLLHCPPAVVISTPKIMRMLSGDFSIHHGESSARNAEFYEAVVRNLPDAVIVASQDYTIEAVNKSCSRIFGVEDNKLIGTKLKEFFDPSRFTGDVQELFHNTDKGTIVNLTLKQEDGTELNLCTSLAIINQKIVVISRDITQTVRYNTLIKEEKTKSDYLLASILPPSLVTRVQAGEKNISFAVQSATIVFMDIVSFTPWCGALPADKVMSTLNLLFKKFDSYVARYRTMTKIKCIGDCYMAAGGVFMEINQPAEHSKEVVSFGLDALDGILELNEEIGEKLQMRVGINTGGPIVAGVLGTEKPTFEILGPAINMAQQMEHHGVAMQVHVTRSVYELIYGDTFTIKERGSVEVKGGTVITYLVSRK